MVDEAMLNAFERCLVESHKESREKGIKDEVCFYFFHLALFFTGVQFYKMLFLFSFSSSWFGRLRGHYTLVMVLSRGTFSTSCSGQDLMA
jgi:hypothetical protein